MRKRMYALLLAGVMVFSQSGLTVMAADAVETETPAVVYEGMTVVPSATTIGSNGGQITFEVSQTVTEYSVMVGDTELEEEQDYSIYNGSTKTYLWIDPNPGLTARTLTVILNGVATDIVQEAPSSSAITGVTLVSRTFLADGKTEFVYDV